MTTQMTETEKKKVKVPQAQAQATLKATSLGILSPPSPYEMSPRQVRIVNDYGISCVLLLDEIVDHDLPYIGTDSTVPESIRTKISTIEQYLHIMKGILP